MTLTIFRPTAALGRRKLRATLADWQQLGADLQRCQDGLCGFLAGLPRTRGIRTKEARSIAYVHTRILAAQQAVEAELVRRALVTPSQGRRLIRGTRTPAVCLWLAPGNGPSPPIGLDQWFALGAAWGSIVTSVAATCAGLTAAGMPKSFERQATALQTWTERAREGLDRALELQHPEVAEIVFVGTGY